MAVDASALRTELLSGANASVYSAALVGGDPYNTLTVLLNSVSTPPTTVTVGLVTAMALQTQVVASEYLALTVAQRDLWNALLTTAAAAGVLPISATTIRTQIGAVWSAATSSRSNLSNLQARTCTRAEALFGEGVAVAANEVYYAVRGVF